MDSPILSPQQRARLRPSVDVEALERLLAALPEAARPQAVLACVADLTVEELAALPGFPGAPACAAGGGPPSGTSAPRTSLAIAFKAPHLQRLWEAVEPPTQSPS